MRDLSVVIFGGTGFIGSHLVARLAGEGVRVLAPTRRYDNGKHLMPLPGVDVVEANIYDDAMLRRLVAGRDAVINLVGVLHARRASPYGPEFRRAHVEL